MVNFKKIALGASIIVLGLVNTQESNASGNPPDTSQHSQDYTPPNNDNPPPDTKRKSKYENQNKSKQLKTGLGATLKQLQLEQGIKIKQNETSNYPNNENITNIQNNTPNNIRTQIPEPTGQELCQLVFNKLRGEYHGDNRKTVSIDCTKLIRDHMPTSRQVKGSTYFKEGALEGLVDSQINIHNIEEVTQGYSANNEKFKNMLLNKRCNSIQLNTTDTTEIERQTGCLIQCESPIGYKNGSLIDLHNIFISIQPSTSLGYTIFNVFPKEYNKQGLNSKF